jgi:predicted GH43/DUF377 family glycosyl hydrolase
MLTKFKNKMKLLAEKVTCPNRNRFNSLIIGDKETGSLFDPYIIELNKLYIMYVSVRSQKSIGITTSEDLIHWSKITIVLKNSKTGWDQDVNRPCVLKRGDTFYMFFTGQSNGVSRIGLAESDNGLDWIKNGEPVLKATEYFEKASVMNPSVIFDSKISKFKMWYSAGDDYEPDIVCYAESDNGISWQKYVSNPIFIKGNHFYDCKKVSVSQVSFIDNQYLMFYIGYETTNKARICLAFSPDGINDWQRYSFNPVMNFGGKFSRNAVYHATFIKKGDEYYVWFNGRTKKIERILFFKLKLR